MYDIIALGELLVDFTPAGHSQNNNQLYELNPGGSVANLAVAASRFGLDVLLLSKVGDDSFGRILRDKVEEYGVDATKIILTSEYQTSLAFVHLFEDGDRDFTFYRKNGADARLTKSDIDLTLIEKGSLLHICSLNMTNSESADAVRMAAVHARKSGKIVSYDPNWRPMLWESAEECKRRMYEGILLADIVKMGEEEMVYIMGDAPDTSSATGTVESSDLQKIRVPDKALSAGKAPPADNAYNTDTDENICDTAYLEYASKVLSLGPKLLLLSKGAAGSQYFFKSGGKIVYGDIPAFKVDAVDATGAGDCYFGTALSQFLKEGLDLNKIDEDIVRGSLLLASAASALCCTKKGGMPAMPSLQEAQALISSI